MPNLNSLVFVIGLPGSGKKFHLLNRIKKGEILSNSGVQLLYDEDDPDKSNVFVADLINIPDSKDEGMGEWDEYMKKVFDKKNKLIIINHFEYNIQDDNTNRIKLNFLEKLMLQDYFKIIIFIKHTPCCVFGFCNISNIFARSKIGAGRRFRTLACIARALPHYYAARLIWMMWQQKKIKCL